MTHAEDTSAPLQGTVRRIRRLPAPLEALQRVRSHPHPFLRMCIGPGARGARWSFLAVAPTRIIEQRVVRPTQDLATLLAPLRPRRVIRHGPRVPFAGGWAGVLGYEARSGVEARPEPRAGPLRFPALWLGAYDAVLAWHHNTGESFVAGLGTTRQAAREAAKALEAAVRDGTALQGDAPVFSAPRAKHGAEAFQKAVAAARQAVLRGDIFQTNVSQRFDARAQSDIDPVALFERLVESQPAPHMTYVDLGRSRQVLSASPERFLRAKGRTVETEPMKGTRPRGDTPAEDRRLRNELEDSEKERAELAMIVDLSRNDLARSCAVGSVHVRVPRRLLRFARVHQAIAVVRGRLARGKDRVDLLRAAFPPGSVTGAPKVRAMEIIDELEQEGRGPYCGALGWFDAGTDMDLSVAIRTILLSRRTASYRVGAGITLRSTPKEEWRETLDKGRGLFAALRLEEDSA